MSNYKQIISAMWILAEPACCIMVYMADIIKFWIWNNIMYAPFYEVQ